MLRSAAPAASEIRDPTVIEVPRNARRAQHAAPTPAPVAPPPPVTVIQSETLWRAADRSRFGITTIRARGVPIVRRRPVAPACAHPPARDHAAAAPLSAARRFDLAARGGMSAFRDPHREALLEWARAAGIPVTPTARGSLLTPRRSR